jgi:two-component system sensor histidine kinase KdpD
MFSQGLHQFVHTFYPVPIKIVSVKISRKVSFAATVAAVFLVTFVFRMVAIVNATTVGFAYLITILLIAASWGIAESVLASFVATVCFNYFFLPPVGTWAIAGPENWIALFTFLISALIASDLSNRAKRRTAEANVRKVEIERLYELSRAMLMMEDSTPIGEQIAKEIARICEIPGVAIYDRVNNLIYRAGTNDLSPTENRLRETAITGAQNKDAETDTLFAPISLGGQSTGSVAINGGGLSNTALHAVLNLMAITFENSRSRQIAIRAQAARQSEEFKSTLLDGLAHEFKTPLTSIRAATTALIASNVSDAAQRDELLTVVDQEAERLSRLVTEATRVARIEAGKIDVNCEWHSVARLIEDVLVQMEPERDGRRVDISIASDLPFAYVDADLMRLALKQLVDNALKYSPRTTAVQISCRLAGNQVLVSVRNQGEPLSDSERTRIFDKFYRGRNVRHQVAGTGMGLPVAREILLAHGGDIRLQSSNERGTEFAIMIPVTKDGR